MSFQFEPKVTVMDMWKLSMRRIYSSMLGVCNIVLAGAIIALTYRFWNEMSSFLQVVLLLACFIFPVLQPISIYMRAAKQLKGVPQDLVLEINDTGLHITGNNQKDHIQWKQVKTLLEEKNMVILAVEGGRGYMLTNRVLGAQRNELLDFVNAKIKKES